MSNTLNGALNTTVRPYAIAFGATKGQRDEMIAGITRDLAAEGLNLLEVLDLLRPVIEKYSTDQIANEMIMTELGIIFGLDHRVFAV